MCCFDLFNSSLIIFRKNEVSYSFPVHFKLPQIPYLKSTVLLVILFLCDILRGLGNDS